jgi:hypothetical protein
MKSAGRDDRSGSEDEDEGMVFAPDRYEAPPPVEHPRQDAWGRPVVKTNAGPSRHKAKPPSQPRPSNQDPRAEVVSICNITDGKFKSDLSTRNGKSEYNKADYKKRKAVGNLKPARTLITVREKDKRKLRDRLRKAKQRKKGKARRILQDSNDKADALGIMQASTDFPEQLNYNPMIPPHLVKVDITSKAETMLAASIWFRRHTLFPSRILVDIPSDEVKPNLSTPEGRTAYNKAYYKKRKAAEKFDGATATQRSYRCDGARAFLRTKKEETAALSTPNAMEYE